MNSKKFIEDVKNLVNRHTNTVFLISCGMLANVVCYEAWKVNRENWYIDIGASILTFVDKGNLEFEFREDTDSEYYKGRKK